MDISQLSKETGIAASKIRYYEQQGLIQSTGRHGLKRTFSSEIIPNLSFIALAQSCGFSLKEISLMLLPDKNFQVDRALILKKVQDIDAKIKQLKKMRTSLMHIHDCKEDNHFHCPNFQRHLKDALKNPAPSHF